MHAVLQTWDGTKQRRSTEADIEQPWYVITGFCSMHNTGVGCVDTVELRPTDPHLLHNPRNKLFALRPAVELSGVLALAVAAGTLVTHGLRADPAATIRARGAPRGEPR